ncbi:MAG: glutamate racemase [Chloroflexi bacterium]|nr:glutamate racemase [Chloroflexota bacterium]
MSDDRPIGVFDSGMGGLSILREIRRLLAVEEAIYLADTAHCPYGPRPAAEVRALAHAITRELLDRGAKLIVVACNTASIAALASLRASFPVPFVGVVPAVKPAATRTRRQRIGVLATAGTLAGSVFDDLVIRFAAGVEVIRVPAPGMVDLVERGVVAGAEAEQVCAEYVRPLIDVGVDTLVLGCSHFPFLRSVIANLAGPDVEIVDTGEPVARQVARILDANNLRCHRERAGRLTLLTTGAVEPFAALAPLLMDEPAAEIGRVEVGEG